MILDQLNLQEFKKNYDQLSGRTLAWYQCDYCQDIFQRLKKTRERSKNTHKDSCGGKACSLEKRKESLRVLYGDDDFFASQEYQKKMQARYGCDHASLSKELMKKSELSRKNTLKESGVVNISQLPGHKEKCEKTNLEKYGKKHYSQTEEWDQRYKATSFERYGETHVLKTDKSKEKSKKTLMKNYGVSFYALSGELKNWFKSLGVEFNSNYTLLDGKEVDLYNDDLKLGIEYCGNYYHTERSPEPRDRTYHYDKYFKCLEKGVFLITIFSDEWKIRKQACKNLLKSKIGIFDKRTYARKCILQEIDKKQADLFYENYHIQGKSPNYFKSWGLFFENQLVASTSLGAHHRQGHNDYVISRLCIADGYSVVGGASRLLKQAIKFSQAEEKKLITWSDNRWSQGMAYKNAGFVLEKELKPDYSYVSMKDTKKRLSKQSQKNKRPPGVVLDEWEVENGLAKIWDCGKKRWVVNF